MNPNFRMNVTSRYIRFIGVGNSHENKELIKEISELVSKKIKNPSRYKLIFDIVFFTLSTSILIFVACLRLFYY